MEDVGLGIWGILANLLGRRVWSLEYRVHHFECLPFLIFIYFFSMIIWELSQKR